MRNPSVDDVSLGDAAAQGGDAGFDFRQHAAGDDAGFHHLVDLFDGDVADAAVGVGGVAADAVRVGDDHELLRLHRCRHGAGGGVGVDVQLPAGVVAGDRGDAGNRVGLHQELEQPRVDA